DLAGGDRGGHGGCGGSPEIGRIGGSVALGCLRRKLDRVAALGREFGDGYRGILKCDVPLDKRAADFLGGGVDVKDEHLVDFAAHLRLDGALHVLRQLDQHGRSSCRQASAACCRKQCGFDK